jgi:hypothetical protein
VIIIWIGLFYQASVYNKKNYSKINVFERTYDCQWNGAFLVFLFIIEGASKKVLQFLCHWNQFTTKIFILMNKNVYYEH